MQKAPEAKTGARAYEADNEREYGGFIHKEMGFIVQWSNSGTAAGNCVNVFLYGGTVCTSARAGAICLGLSLRLPSPRLQYQGRSADNGGRNRTETRRVAFRATPRQSDMIRTLDETGARQRLMRAYCWNIPPDKLD